MSYRRGEDARADRGPRGAQRRDWDEGPRRDHGGDRGADGYRQDGRNGDRYDDRYGGRGRSGSWRGGRDRYEGRPAGRYHYEDRPWQRSDYEYRRGQRESDREPHWRRPPPPREDYDRSDADDIRRRRRESSPERGPRRYEQKEPARAPPKDDTQSEPEKAAAPTGDPEDEEAQMAAMMGFGNFGSSKVRCTRLCSPLLLVQGKPVENNATGYAEVRKERTWRQYMNRYVAAALRHRKLTETARVDLTCLLYTSPSPRDS